MNVVQQSLTCVLRFWLVPVRVENMSVGMKVQAIVPPGLAFGDKGLCLESGECLIKPKSTLVYDVALKRASIPPP